MRCYAMTEKGNKIISRFMSKNRRKENVEKLLSSLQLDGSIVRLDTLDYIRFETEKQSYEQLGYRIAWFPEDESESQEVVKELSKKGLRIRLNDGGSGN